MEVEKLEWEQIKRIIKAARAMNKKFTSEAHRELRDAICAFDDCTGLLKNGPEENMPSDDEILAKQMTRLTESEETPRTGIE